MQGDYGRLDPYQVRNLAEEKSFAAPLREYRRRSQKWRKERDGTFEFCTWYRDHWTADRNITLTATGVKQNLEEPQKVSRNWPTP